MSHEVSPATGKPYGVKRVCAALNVSRSTVYARQKAGALPKPVPAGRGFSVSAAFLPWRASWFAMLPYSMIWLPI